MKFKGIKIGDLLQIEYSCYGTFRGIVHSRTKDALYVHITKSSSSSFVVGSKDYFVVSGCSSIDLLERGHLKRIKTQSENKIDPPLDLEHRTFTETEPGLTQRTKGWFNKLLGK
jgi:hypothetical protein